MSWLHKFFDLFLGESEEDAERGQNPLKFRKNKKYINITLKDN